MTKKTTVSSSVRLKTLTLWVSTQATLSLWHLLRLWPIKNTKSCVMRHWRCCVRLAWRPVVQTYNLVLTQKQAVWWSSRWTHVSAVHLPWHLKPRVSRLPKSRQNLRSAIRSMNSAMTLQAAWPQLALSLPLTMWWPKYRALTLKNFPKLTAPYLPKWNRWVKWWRLVVTSKSRCKKRYAALRLGWMVLMSILISIKTTIPFAVP